MKKHGHVDETLTFSERLAPFLLAPADPFDPLPPVTRLQCEIDGDTIIDEWDARAWLAEHARQAAASSTDTQAKGGRNDEQSHDAA